MLERVETWRFKRRVFSFSRVWISDIMASIHFLSDVSSVR